MLNTTEDKAYKIQLDVLFYASANAVCCYKNPLVQKALKQIDITPPPMDFYKDMKDFLKMRLAWKEQTKDKLKILPLSDYTKVD